jgi:CRISPR/Cas system endoribonuclease Cas6 (RAMP superfamily)
LGNFNANKKGAAFFAFFLQFIFLRYCLSSAKRVLKEASGLIISTCSVEMIEKLVKLSTSREEANLYKFMGIF